MDVDVIFKIKSLVDEIRGTENIKHIANSLEQLFNELEPLVTDETGISKLVASALATYNSIMCVPDALS